DLPIFMGALSYHRNRTNPKVDIDSNNNFLLKEMKWKSIGKLSLNTVAFENNISAYPNPANSNINVALNYVQQGATTIELINLNGQVVVSQNAQDMFNTSNTMDVSNLEKGLYILRITNGDATYTRKVSVAH
ncbi:MAG: T9SS type A sorting domain-containing protein, partial [Bacteroidia bacterium]